MAEKERFELSRRYSRPTPLAGAPLRPLEYFSVYSSRSAVCIQPATPILYTFLACLSSPFLFFAKFFYILFHFCFFCPHFLKILLTFSGGDGEIIAHLWKDVKPSDKKMPGFSRKVLWIFLGNEKKDLTKRGKRCIIWVVTVPCNGGLR